MVKLEPVTFHTFPSIVKTRIGCCTVGWYIEEGQGYYKADHHTLGFLFLGWLPKVYFIIIQYLRSLKINILFDAILIFQAIFQKFLFFQALYYNYLLKFVCYIMILILRNILQIDAKLKHVKTFQKYFTYIELSVVHFLELIIVSAAFIQLASW